eukprot:1153277-Pelagomonas_calceolata.AAC.10
MDEIFLIHVVCPHIIHAASVHAGCPASSAPTYEQPAQGGFRGPHDLPAPAFVRHRLQILYLAMNKEKWKQVCEVCMRVQSVDESCLKIITIGTCTPDIMSGSTLPLHTDMHHEEHTDMHHKEHTDMHHEEHTDMHHEEHTDMHHKEH